MHLRDYLIRRFDVVLAGSGAFFGPVEDEDETAAEEDALEFTMGTEEEDPILASELISLIFLSCSPPCCSPSAIVASTA